VSHEYEYPNLMPLNLEPQAMLLSLLVYMYHRNRQWGTSVPDDMEQAHVKMIGQTDNEHLDISFICHLFSFLLWDASSNVHHGYAANFHHKLCMA
jgi:hypothetical protein